MSLKLYRRDGSWHYRGTIGPPERRARLRGSLKTSDKAAAQREIADITARYWKGYQDGPAAILTFEAAAMKYLAAGKSPLFLDPVKDYLGKTLVKDIRPSTIRQMAIDLYGHCKNTTRNRMGITPACAVINFMAKSELCSPIRVEHFEDDSEPKDPATMEWVQDLRRAKTTSEILGTYALFMFLTGCRPTEGLQIDPERDLDLRSGTCIIRNKKVRGQHKGRRKAHLPEILVEALANMPREAGRPLFWYQRYQVMKNPWDKAVREAKLQKLTPHCCRHGCATELLRRGVDVVTVGWLIDMTPEMVLETYGHALKDATLTNRLIDTDLTRAMSEVAEIAAKTGTYGT
jgi:integrase